MHHAPPIAAPLLAAGVVLAVFGLQVCAARPAAAASPEVNAAVARGVKLLKESVATNKDDGRAVLAAYALLKAGEPADSPEVRGVIAAIQKRCAGADYNAASDHYYTAGLELMLLADADAERLRPDMQKILNYILRGQQEYGAWFYPNQNGLGDTSITQYSVLGLWAAERAGLQVPTEAWDRLALWHLQSQHPDGGFGYHPDQTGGGESTATMTAAGTANLLLAHRFLFPSAAEPGGAAPAETPAAPAGKRFGVLESIDVSGAAGAPGAKGGGPRAASRLSRTALEQAATRSLAWSASHFRPRAAPSWPLYYLYGIERMAALANTQTLGPVDWYAVGSASLVREQQADGSWAGDNSGPAASTAFGVLFLVQATGKTLGRIVGSPLGGGLLAGGRGLPTAATATTAKAAEPAGPLDELLARLDNPAATELPTVQAAVLDAVRFGDRETLIGQRERLRALVMHPEPEVRRTACWALGRGGELADAKLLIGRLSDPDVTVATEANNGLCMLARRPLGLGVPADPLSGAAENASDAAKETAYQTWQKQAVAAWTNWYRRVAPYAERDGLGPLRDPPG